MHRRLVVMFSVVSLLGLILVSGLVYVKHRNAEPTTVKTVESEATKTFKDAPIGIKFSIPVSYSEEPNTNPAIKNFVRVNPQGFLTIKYEAGLGAAAAIAKRSVQEHIEAEIRQFFPVRYGKTYKSVSITRLRIQNKEAIEHVFTFSDQSGSPRKVHLTAVIWDDDSAYYFITQGHESLYDRLKQDHLRVLEGLSLFGPN